MDTDMETASDASVRFVESDSGSDTAGPAADRRGNSKKSGLSRARIELKANEDEERELAFERTLRSRAFKKTPVVVPEPEEAASLAKVDPALQSNEELRAEAGRSAREIREVALKSSNLKGGFIKRLKDAAASLEGVVEALASRTEADEARNLRADNSRLRREIDSLKAELKAHRREYAEMRTTVAAATEAANTPRGAPSMEELKDFIVTSIGAAMKDQLAGLEERLPARMQRPPSAADKTQMSQGPPPSISTAHQDGGVGAPAKPRKAAPLAAQTTPTACPPTAPAPATSQTPPNQETSWSTVVKKGRKGSKTTPSDAKTLPKTPQPAKSKLVTPRSAAIVLTLQPEAVGKGVTYAQAHHTLRQRSAQRTETGDMAVEVGAPMARAETDDLGLNEGLAARPVRLSESDLSVCSMLTVESGDIPPKRQKGEKRNHTEKSCSGSESDASVQLSDNSESSASREVAGGVLRVKSKAKTDRFQTEDALAAYNEAAKLALKERAACSRNRQIEAQTEDAPKTSAALDATVQQALDVVLQVADKSGNLKGTFVKALKTAADTIKGAVAKLRALTMSEEVDRLEAANAQLPRASWPNYGERWLRCVRSHKTPTEKTLSAS
ncbi:actin cytoskeleton-regulatory complex protein pan1-like [Vanessa atalanta]|uniref:actin cytoskeleton-regulatory complex protein pan1-like n=1 Tax=Vanessa atalanta TaxID=42275 RepID=UPI001FCDAA72|nr:actin cytoskeleton-regulatory complex protein pan1-like [Vanessa atalanta]